MPSAAEILRKYTDTKTLPYVAIKVTQMVNDPNSTMQDFENVIKLDPVLVTRLLRLVNSPYFGLSTTVESIAKAVVFIGMKNLRNLVTVEAMRDFFKGPEGSENELLNRKSLWLHCATVSLVSQMIAKRIFGDGREDFFLAGIIHDIGMIIEDQVVGDLLRKACALYQPGVKPLIVCEREVIGTDHCEVGALLAKEWKMPEEVMLAIRFHHDYERKQAVESVNSVVQLAEYMAGKLQYSALAGRVDPLPTPLVRHVKNMMSNYKILVRDFPAEMAMAKELYHPDE